MEKIMEKVMASLASRTMIFVCLSATFLLTGCSSKPEREAKEKIIPVKTLHIAASAVAGEMSYVGTVEESAALSLGFSVMGTVEQMLVSEGQAVNKGQLLATLNTVTAQNSVDAAQATLRQAQDAYDRLSKLHDNGSLPDIKFVEVETGLQQAKSMLAVAEKNLDDCRLYAPRNGVIATRSVEAGESVMPGVTAFKLVSVDKVNVKVVVPENEIGSIRIGQTASITVPALNNAVFTGKIEMKGIAASALSHTYEVKIGVDNNVGATHALPPLPGMVCKVTLAAYSSATAVVVPNRAIRISPGGKRFVWLAAGNVARRNFVQTGSLTNDGIVVTEGLPAGSEVIVEGFQKVSEGMKISIK
ncbi:MAG: efflux RND transporter periplasmic adaptor subunit [Prevotellaceae bacterium]|nr:efflux RND transporter periplasmic adaptor subunit [Prevotellaceae bacterium]